MRAKMKKFLKNCFCGRVARKRYWLFFLNVFLAWGLGPFLSFILINLGIKRQSFNFSTFGSFFWVSFLVTLPLVYLSYLSMSVRRLHDTNRSGVWFLIKYVPIIGWILLIIRLSKKGCPAANKYRPPQTVCKG